MKNLFIFFLFIVGTINGQTLIGTLEKDGHKITLMKDKYNYILSFFDRAEIETEAYFDFNQLDLVYNLLSTSETLGTIADNKRIKLKVTISDDEEQSIFTFYPPNGDKATPRFFYVESNIWGHQRQLPKLTAEEWKTIFNK